MEAIIFSKEYGYQDGRFVAVLVSVIQRSLPPWWVVKTSQGERLFETRSAALRWLNGVRKIELREVAPY